MTHRVSTRLLSGGAALVLATALAACGGDDEDGTTGGTATGGPPTGAAATSAAAPTTGPTAGAPTAGTTTGGGAATATGSISAENQPSDGTTLTVSSVTLNGIQGGFIAVHQDMNGAPGPVIGVAPVEQGTTENVVVTFEDPVSTGDFWPMLHVDDSEIGTYEFGESEGAADAPVLADGQPVMERITLTVS